ncbi:hypothetical protein AB0D59_45455 [Streptomyces sp. NPDC048417]|uniref:hypothetical protein n=1 Tax=Streptomyces sp. NPDC048417 TaxID=3155387 RepID=UPI00341871AE
MDRVETAVYTVATDAPAGDGTLTWESTTMIVIQVSGGGATGLGYAYGSAATAQVVERQLAEVVTGRCALDTPAANEAMNRAVRDAGRPGLIAGAVAAVDIALWDLKARLLELPLVRLLGVSRTDVPVYGSGGFTTYDQRQLDRQLRHWTEDQDIPRVKIKIRESWGRAECSSISPSSATSARCVGAHATAVGPQHRLRLSGDRGATDYPPVAPAADAWRAGVLWAAPCAADGHRRGIRDMMDVNPRSGGRARNGRIRPWWYRRCDGWQIAVR